MSIPLKGLLILVAIVISQQYEFKPLKIGSNKAPDSWIKKVNAQTLLKPFLNRDIKILFKAWHFVFHKQYDYNTEDGIRKYRNFKKNLKKINEHNKSKSSFKKGLNNLTDMTNEEVKKYFNLKTFNIDEIVSNLRGTGDVVLDKKVSNSLPIKITHKVGEFPKRDWRKYMQEVREAGECSAPFAYATADIAETCFTLWQEQVPEPFSAQQILDCTRESWSCQSIGWFSLAMRYFQSNNFVYDKAYPLTGGKGTCHYTKGMEGDTKVRATGYQWYRKGEDDTSKYYEMLSRGPVGVAVNANEDWYSYQSGIYDGECESGINHLVVLAGYGCTESEGNCAAGCYFLIRNSWGAQWGEIGYMRIKDNGEESSCNVEEFAYQFKGFTESP